MGYTLATFNNEVHTMEIFARNPVSCEYVVPPDSCCIEVGACPLNPLPAQYWNYYTREETYTRNYLQKYVADIYTDTRDASRCACLLDCFAYYNFQNHSCTESVDSLSCYFSSCGACGIYPEWDNENSCIYLSEMSGIQWYKMFADTPPVFYKDSCLSYGSVAPSVPLLYSSMVSSYLCKNLVDGDNFLYGVERVLSAQALYTDYANERKYCCQYVSLCCDFGVCSSVLENIVCTQSPTEVFNCVQDLWYRCFGQFIADTKTTISCTLLVAHTSRWLRFVQGAKKSLLIKAGTFVRVGTHLFCTNADTTYDLSADITENGKDYFVYLEWSAGDNWTLRASLIKVADTSTSRYIGRFHTLCNSVAANTSMIVQCSPSVQVGNSLLVKPYTDDDADFKAFYTKTVAAVDINSTYSVATVSHPLAGFSAGDILPESIWCASFKPDASVEDAMVYDRSTNKAIDVYLQSGQGTNTRSAYNATHTVDRPQICHQDDFLQVGKELLSDTEFTSAAIGSNEKTSITGASDKTTVGGHTDTAGRRMISAIGCEEMCGYLWQWCRDVAPLGTGTAYSNAQEPAGNVGNGWITIDKRDVFGKMYDAIAGLLLGGSWYIGTDCGSRSRSANPARSNCVGDFGGRGSSRVVMR